MAKSNDVKHKFVELRAKGLSFDKIAKELKTSKQTLIDWSKEFQLDIQNLQAIELESLQEEFLALKRQRIESIGKTMQKINQALDKTDFYEITTEKLLELKLKYLKELRNEQVPLQFQTFEKESLMDFSVLDNQEILVDWKA